MKKTATQEQAERVDGRLTTRSVPIHPSSLDEATRSVEAVITTSDRTTIFDWSRWQQIDEVLVMRGGKIPDQVVFLHCHRRESVEEVFGSIRDMRKSEQDVVGRIFFADPEDPKDPCEKAWKKVKQGHVKSVSAGYYVTKWVYIEPGETKKVGGKEYTAGVRALRVSTEWELMEGSLVPIGADDKAKMRGYPSEEPGQDPEKERENGAMKKGEGVKGGEGLESGVRSLEEEERMGEGTPAQRSADTTPPAPPRPESSIDMTAIRQEAVQAERDRVRGIRELSDLTGSSVPAELVEKAVDEGWDQERTRKAFHDGMSNGRTPAVGQMEVVRELSEGLNDALITATSMREGVEPRDERARREAAPFAGIGLRDIARLVVEREFGRAGMTHDANALYTRAISTGSFAEILGSSATKVLQRAYEAYPSTLRRWAGRRSVSDFKTYNNLRLSGFSQLLEVGEAGELKHGALTETKETFGASTYGLRFSVTRKMFVNDDLGVFFGIPRSLGTVAGRTLDTIGYALLVSNSGVGPTMNEDSTALFATTRTTPNYKVGATTTLLDPTGLKNGKALMRKITGDAGEILGLSPRFILFPTDLEEDALRNVSSAEIVLAKAGTTDATTIMASKNIHQGTLEPIVEPRLDATSTTAWYLICDQAVQESLVIVSLNGNEMPVVERKDPVDVLGLGWWVYHDVGVAVIDWRGMVRLKGAS